MTHAYKIKADDTQNGQTPKYKKGDKGIFRCHAQTKYDSIAFDKANVDGMYGVFLKCDVMTQQEKDTNVPDRLANVKTFCDD